MLTYRREKRDGHLLHKVSPKGHTLCKIFQEAFSRLKTRWALELDNLKGKTLYFLTN